MRNRILLLAAMAAMAAAAQELVPPPQRIEGERFVAQAKILGVRGAVMGNPVKGAPYSAVEITESTQVLADGTRIHNESQAAVYRDSEGRTRRETPDEVTIYDPVAKVSYLLRPKEQTARQLPFGAGGTFRMTADGKSEIFTYQVSGGAPVTEADAKKLKGVLDEAQVRGTSPPPSPLLPALIAGEPVNHTVFLRTQRPGKAEALGKQAIEGVMAEGTRTVSVIETGEIGNDRPIEIVSERWYSTELQTPVRTRHTDPRSGEESFRLTNISRSEPPAYLFQVPAGYQMPERR